MANSTQHAAHSQNSEKSSLAVGRKQFAVGEFVFGARVVAAVAAIFALSACGNIEPWVKPYEREALADPIMSFDMHPISTSYSHHVFEAREGARGAQGSAGGGCGCN